MLTEQQKKDRTKGIGGSDVAIILGLSTYKTPYELFLEKIGQTVDDSPMTELQYWGNVLEPIIVKEYEKRFNVKISHPDTIIHPFLPYMRANVDGFIDEQNLVFEAKTSSAFMASEWGESGSDIVPMSYLVQVIHYIACTNADGAATAVLIGGNDFRDYIYKKDLKLQTEVINACKEFWHCVETQTEPTLQTISDLNKKYGRSVPGKDLVVDDEVTTALLKLSDTKAQIKKLTEIEKDYKFAIAKYMQDAEVLVDGNGDQLATYRTNKRGSRSLILKGL